MKTKNSSPARNVVLAALFLALAFVLPMVTGHLPQVGNMLCPIGQSILPTCGRWPVTMGSTKASARKSAASTTLRAGEEFLVFICFLL